MKPGSGAPGAAYRDCRRSGCFVKTVKMTGTNMAYCQNTFHEAWCTAILRYDIYNPWTGKGAIKGLPPHSPHNLRDVLATPILKQTGSYEQASYAVQDTAEIIAHRYGRFPPPRSRPKGEWSFANARRQCHTL